MKKLSFLFILILLVSLLPTMAGALALPENTEYTGALEVRIYDGEDTAEPVRIVETEAESGELDFALPEDIDIPPEEIYVEVAAGDEIIVERSPLERPTEPMATSVIIGNGSDDIYLDGQVGIGTNSPTSALEIVEGGNDVAIEFDGGSDFITIHDGYGNFNILSGLDNNNNIVGSSGGGTRLEMSEGGYFDFEIYNGTAAVTNHLYIGQSESYFDGANVGIGTSSPNSELDVD